MSGTLPDWLPHLPSGWNVKPFYTVMQERSQPNSALAETRVLSLSYGRVIDRDVDNNFGLLPASFEGYNIVEPDDIVMRLTDMQNDQRSLRTGRVVEKGIITSAYVTVTPGELLAPKFAHYLLHGYDLAKVYYGMGGGLRQSLKYADLKRMPVVVPPPEEQERIANFLDEQAARIDALIAEKERLVDRISELRDSEFSRVLTLGLRQEVETYPTGNPALPEIPAGWKLSRLKWVCSLLRDGTHTPPPRVDVGVPLLSVRNVQNGEFTFLPDDSLISEEDYLELNRSFEVRQGDVLLAVVGATMGKVAEVRDMGRPFQIQPSLAVMRPKPSEIGPTLLAAAIRAEYFQSLLWQNTGFSAQPGTYLGALADFPIPVPPHEEQSEIVAHLSRKGRDFENLIQHTVEHISRLREYRSSLISAAVTGQLDISTFKVAA